MRVAPALLLLIACSGCGAVSSSFDVMMQRYQGNCVPPVMLMPCCISAPAKTTLTVVSELGENFKVRTDYEGKGKLLLLPGKYTVQYEGCEGTEEIQIEVSSTGITYEKNTVEMSGTSSKVKQENKGLLEININCCKV